MNLKESTGSEEQASFARLPHAYPHPHPHPNPNHVSRMAVKDGQVVKGKFEDGCDLCIASFGAEKDSVPIAKAEEGGTFKVSRWTIPEHVNDAIKNGGVVHTGDVSAHSHPLFVIIMQ